MKFFQLILSLCFFGCNFYKTAEKSPMPLDQKVTWDGQRARVYAQSVSENADSTNPASPIQTHTFLFMGTDTLRLRLIEFSTRYWAFSEFLKEATPQEIEDGFYQKNDSVFFSQGNFFGVLGPLGTGALTADSLKSSLGFQGEELFEKPAEFGTFPLLGRIPYSERIIVNHFLGKDWQGPVFTVSYRCHNDSAIAFRAFPQNIQDVQLWIKGWTGKQETLNGGKELRFQGWDEFRQPLHLEVFSSGIMGLSQCYDPQLVQEYAEKMEKTAVLWRKP